MILARIWLFAGALAWIVGTSGAAQTEPPSTVYIHAGTLLDRPDRAPRGASTIIVRSGRIDLVRDGLVAPEPGAKLIDLSTQFVLPGLIDLHVHLLWDNDRLRARLEQNSRDIEDNLLIGVDNARRTLEAGFTTVRDMGSDIRSITALRDAITNGSLPGPTIVAAGPIISITGGHGDPANNTNRDFTETARGRATNLCDGPDDCRRAVREQISQGADVIKFAATGGVTSNVGGGLNQQMFADEMKAIIDTAHLFGRKVAAHAHGQNGIQSAIDAGSDSIEHGTYTDARTNALFMRTGVWLVPTMSPARAALAQAHAGVLPKATLAKAEESAAAHAKNVARAIRDGVKIAFGTDSGVAEHGKNAEEFSLLVQAGLTPAAAIRAATLDAATVLDRLNQLGSIEPGKDADIVAVAASPLNDVTELQRIRFVMRQGNVHMLNGARRAFPVAGSGQSAAAVLPWPHLAWALPGLNRLARGDSK
jgi:imidazolonepropionase-like amidohydrolase